MKICAKYCGTTVLLAEVETEEEAEAFMRNKFYIEYENGYPSDVIYPDEMFIDDDDIPFDRPPQCFELVDDLPF